VKYIKKVPTPVTGVALSLAALGNLLAPYGNSIRLICGVLSAAILCVFLARLIFDFERVKQDLKNPVALSVLPTATMTLMLLCVYIKPYAGFVNYVWYLAIIAHVMIMLLFVRRFIIGLKIETVFPSWFVAYVGIAAASVTSPAMDARPVGQALFYVGLILYFFALPVVVYKMIKSGPLPEPARPTIAIFTAPVSLCAAGYLSAFEQPSALLVYILLAISVISYLYVLVNMPFLLRLKFYPSCAAFTFPFVISAAAFKAINVFLTANGRYFFSFAPKAAEWLAVIAVVYVLVRYIMFITADKPAAPR
jgi:exfoliative toxin A/B